MAGNVDYREVARQKARKYGIPAELFERQIQAESGFNPSARSPAGATGIAQIMPGTAQAWGVNPNNPSAALDAAARNMAAYVKKYGSYKNALVAYNAGPGRVGGPLPAETQAYIKKIMGGYKGPDRTNPSGGDSGGSTTTTRTIPGQDFSAQRLVAKQGYLMNRDSPNALLDLASALKGLKDTPSRTVTTRTPGGGGGGSSRGGGTSLGGKSPLFELFYNGAGGVNVKNGQREPKGFVSGHTDHVHVAAGPKTIDRIGRVAQERFGLHVGENPTFGGVNPVHVQNSYHYKNEAIDVSGDPKKMRAFNQWVAKQYGIK